MAVAKHGGGGVQTVLDDELGEGDALLSLEPDAERRAVHAHLGGYLVEGDGVYVVGQKRMLIESGCIVLPYFRQQGCPLLEPGKLHGLNFFASAWATLENIFLAATNEGLATCIHITMGDEVERINAMVGSPKDY